MLFPTFSLLFDHPNGENKPCIDNNLFFLKKAANFLNIKLICNVFL